MLASSRNTLVLVLLLAFALRFTGSWFGYPWLEQYDESQELVKPALKILDFGQTHGVAPITHNGPLPKYLLALVFGLWGLGAKLVGSADSLIELLRTTTTANIAARLVIGVLAGTIGVWVVWQAGKRLAGVTAGLAAAFLLAVAFKPVEFAHYATSDTMAALAISLVLLFTLRYYDTGSFRDLAWASLFWAGGVAIKLSLAPAVTLLLAGILARPGLRWKARLQESLKAASIGLAAVLILHLPYLTNPRPYIVAITDLMLTAVALYNKGFFWYFDPQVYPAIEIPTAGVGWTWLSLGLAGMILSLRLPGRKKWILLTFALVFYLILGTSRIKLTRYFLPMVPILAIWGGVAIAWLNDFLSKRISPQRLRSVLVGAVVLIFALPGLYHSALFSLQACGPNTAMQLDRYLSQTLVENDNALALAGSPIRAENMLQLSAFINKSSYQDGVRNELVKKNPRLKDWVGESPRTAADPPGSAYDLPPDSAHFVHGVNYIILDEYRVWDAANIPEKYMFSTRDLLHARRFIQAVQKDWDLVATFTPRYRQPWGESCAGRQPTVWVYRWPGLENSSSKP